MDGVSAYTRSTYPGLRGGVSPSLPPVVTTSADDGHHVHVQWGDLTFGGFAQPDDFGLPGFQSGDEVAVTAHVTVLAGLDLAYDSDSDALTGTVGSLDVRLQVATEAGARLDEAALATAVEAAIADYVETALPQSAAGVQVPVIELTGQAGVPAGTVIRLQQATVARDGRTTKLMGEVGN